MSAEAEELANLRKLVEQYHGEALAEAARVEAVLAVLERNGCDCDCGHDQHQHDDDCELCLACRVERALAGPEG